MTKRTSLMYLHLHQVVRLLGRPAVRPAGHDPCRQNLQNRHLSFRRHHHRDPPPGLRRSFFSFLDFFSFFSFLSFFVFFTLEVATVVSDP